MTLDDRVMIAELLAEYGALLTEKQRAVLTMYCEMDLSLHEVAQEYGISRQAVRDVIVRAVAALEQYEAALGAVQKRRRLMAVLQDEGQDPQVRIAAAQQLLEE